jgi:hypothetical protein
MLVVVQFDGDKLAHEHLHWDQASVLVQLGLLQPEGLPVVGAGSARSVLDRSIRLNELLHRQCEGAEGGNRSPKACSVIFLRRRSLRNSQSRRSVDTVKCLTKRQMQI